MKYDERPLMSTDVRLAYPSIVAPVTQISERELSIVDLALSGV